MQVSNCISVYTHMLKKSYIVLYMPTKTNKNRERERERDREKKK